MDSVDKLRVSNDASDYQWIRSEYLNKIADEIEAEIAEQSAFIERLRKAVENGDDVTLWDADYMRLPVDADGIPIRLGDRLEGWKHPIDEISFAATGIALDNCKGEHVTLHMLETDLRHHHPPTIEDVLEEFVRKAVRIGAKGGVTPDITVYALDDDIAEYADKLREVLENE